MRLKIRVGGPDMAFIKQFFGNRVAGAAAALNPARAFDKTGGGRGGTVGAVIGAMAAGGQDWGTWVASIVLWRVRTKYPDIPADVIPAIEGLTAGITTAVVACLGALVGSWFSRGKDA